MVQNHMLQLLCLVAMEPPASLDADAVRDEKLKVLRALRPFEPHEALTQTVRGQYTQGAIDGQPVPGYIAELNGPRPASTETFVALKAEVRQLALGGVPFYLRTGKRLPQKVSEIVIQYRAAAASRSFRADAAEWHAEQADHPAAAGRGHAACDDDQGPGPRRPAPVADRRSTSASRRRSACAFRTPMNGC